MQEMDNFLPSVDLGGFVDRNGTRLVAAAPMVYSNFASHMFRTSDGQTWALLKRSEYGTLEIRNLSSGVVASISYGPSVQDYIGDSSTTLRFLTLEDTTFILNTGVPTAGAETAKSPRASAYLIVKKLTTAAQSFALSTGLGGASYQLVQNQANAISRDFAAFALQQKIAQNLPGLSAVMVASNIIRISGPQGIIDSCTFTNDWDESASQLIKDRVFAITDLRPVRPRQERMGRVQLRRRRRHQCQHRRVVYAHPGPPDGPLRLRGPDVRLGPQEDRGPRQQPAAGLHRPAPDGHVAVEGPALARLA
jgi:hypothetical protein